jgi:hypothetical protein
MKTASSAEGSERIVSDSVTANAAATEYDSINGWLAISPASRQHAATRSTSASLVTFTNGCQNKRKEHEGFTAKCNCDRLVWFEGHQDIARAIARGKALKGWRRAKKIALMSPMNAVWTELSGDWYEYEPADYKRTWIEWKLRSNRRPFGRRGDRRMTPWRNRECVPLPSLRANRSLFVNHDVVNILLLESSSTSNRGQAAGPALAGVGITTQRLVALHTDWQQVLRCSELANRITAHRLSSACLAGAGYAETAPFHHSVGVYGRRPQSPGCP